LSSRKKSINHNDLLPWFIQDHGTLPKAYVESCQKFFDEIQASSLKQQATSMPQSGDTVVTKQKGKS
tara:strand:- start:123 stop:323 length:201 start_codon:yes stop_codon:yes gene_type:complete